MVSLVYCELCIVCTVAEWTVSGGGGWGGGVVWQLGKTYQTGFVCQQYTFYGKKV
jgi:hypothetical protein